MSIIHKSSVKNDDVALLAYPYPYRSWLAVSNDPDNTRITDWQELHRVIWEELRLPFGDSFFICNYNENFPEQVNLVDHPQILCAHSHDTMHTWGDYTWSTKHRFSRKDGQLGLERLKELGVSPFIWTDHSSFSGNLLHMSSISTSPIITDTAGHKYTNFEYTLDLIRQAGVRYIWDGSVVVGILGQDRPISRDEWYSYALISSRRWKQKVLALMDVTMKPLWDKVGATAFSYAPDKNRQYYRKTFADSQTFYCFTRYGQWGLANIDGLGEMVAPEEIDRLIDLGGTAIIYTHLGKRRACRIDDDKHIPPYTLNALRHLAIRYSERKIMLSPTSSLLDYLVLRDHAKVNGRHIDFRSDGITFKSLEVDDLDGFEFGIYSSKEGSIKITCNGSEVKHTIVAMGNGFFRLLFHRDRCKH